jgi:hypothetical protein
MEELPMRAIAGPDAALAGVRACRRLRGQSRPKREL